MEVCGAGGDSIEHLIPFLSFLDTLDEVEKVSEIKESKIILPNNEKLAITNYHIAKT